MASVSVRSARNQRNSAVLITLFLQPVIALLKNDRPTSKYVLNISDADRNLLCHAPYAAMPEPREQIRWLHIPKTGTSFANTIWHYGCPKLPANVSVANYDTRFEGSINDEYPIENWCPALIDHTPSTHKPIGETEWRKHEGHFVAMFREPSARLDSAFHYGNHHCIQDCNPENDYTVLNKPLQCHDVRDVARRESEECVNLHGAACPEDYAQFRAANGCTTKMIIGYPCNHDVQIKESRKQKARERLRSGFSFVGIVEEWDLSLCLFHRIFGGVLSDIEKAYVRSDSDDELPSECAAAPPLEDTIDDYIYAEAHRLFERDVKRALKKIKLEAHQRLVQPHTQANV